MTTIKILGQEPIENVKKSDVTRKSCARVDELTAKLKAAESVNEWISVEDRLPELNDCIWQLRDLGERKLVNDCIWDNSELKCYKLNNMTHWMICNKPLPTNPI